MKAKIFELRDHATRISVVAFQGVGESEREDANLKANGFRKGNVVLLRLNNMQAQYDSFLWDSEIMQKCHWYIQTAYDRLISGEVIDVRVLKGERAKPVESDFATSAIETYEELIEQARQHGTAIGMGVWEAAFGDNKTNLSIETNPVCLHCSKEYDYKELKRTNGEDFAKKGYCSAQCFTKSIVG